MSQQAREEDLDRVRAFYASERIEADIRPFFEDVPERMAEAQLVIARAGASTIADLSVIGRPAILIPYAAAAEDHQTANARGLAEAGGAEVVPEAGFSAEALTARLSGLLSDPERAARMARPRRASAARSGSLLAGTVSHGRADAATSLKHGLPNVHRC